MKETMAKLKDFVAGSRNSSDSNVSRNEMPSSAHPSSASSGESEDSGLGLNSTGSNEEDTENGRDTASEHGLRSIVSTESTLVTSTVVSQSGTDQTGSSSSRRSSIEIEHKRSESTDSNKLKEKDKSHYPYMSKFHKWEASLTKCDLTQANKIIGGKHCPKLKGGCCKSSNKANARSEHFAGYVGDKEDLDAQADAEMQSQDQKKMFSFSLPFGNALEHREFPGTRHVKRALQKISMSDEKEQAPSYESDTSSEYHRFRSRGSSNTLNTLASTTSSRHTLSISENFKFFDGNRKREAELAELTALEPTLSKIDAQFVMVKQLNTSRSKTVTKSIKRNFTVNTKKFEVPKIDGDVVVLGGYRGSILRDTKTGRRVWIPFKVALNMRKIDLTVGPKDEDELKMEESIYPDGMLSHVGPVDLSRKLLRKLAEYEGCNVHEFGYDWRLSCDLSSKKLREFLRGIVKKQKNKKGVIVIAHSMGGLVTHHAMNQEPGLFRGVLYCGSPSSCVNILGPIRFGDDVLFSSRVLTPKVNFLMRSSFVFLPLDGHCFVDAKDPTHRYDLDYYDPKVWVEHDLSPYVSRAAKAQHEAEKQQHEHLIKAKSAIKHALSPKKSDNSEDHSGKIVDEEHHHPQRSHTEDQLGNSSNNFKIRAIRHQATDISDRLINKSTGLIKNSSDKIKSSTTNMLQPINDSILLPLNDFKEEPLPFDVAYEYLERTLQRTEKFRHELFPRPDQSYPPLACLYGESVPTVRAAKVNGIEGIRDGDYNNLLFGAGDGVVYRKSLMPEGVGFPVVAKVRSERDHVTLLNDIGGVGQCLQALLDAEKDPQVKADKIEEIKRMEHNNELSRASLDDQKHAEAEGMNLDQDPGHALTMTSSYDGRILWA